MHTFPMNLSRGKIEITLTKVNCINVVFIYKPPSVNVSLLVKALEAVHHTHLHHSQAVIMGDFNIDYQNSPSQQTKLMNATSQLGYHQLIHEPTTDLGSTLDLIFTNIDNVLAGVLEVYFSDHKMIWAAM